jgi:hypothetical protein
MQPVYDPRGVVGAEKKAIAARVRSLDGLRLGILDNTKWNANKLLRELRDQLQAQAVEKIRVENDIVVTAIGD